MPINFFKDIVYPVGANVSRFTPSKDLEALVEGYYLFTSKGLEGRQLFFNDGYPVVAFMQEKDGKTKINVDGQVQSVESMWVCGGILKNIYCESPLSFENLFVVRFHPAAFFKMFNISQHYFESTQIFSFSEIAGSDFKAFNEAFYASASIEERIELTNNFLSKKTIARSFPRILADILTFIDRQGVLTVQDLLKGYNGSLNYKWLERTFKEHLGMSPKNYLLIRRFLNAYLDLYTSGTKELLEVAIDHGYYDDNHFIKDFRKFSGVPPKTYFHRRAKASKAIYKQ